MVLPKTSLAAAVVPRTGKIIKKKQSGGDEN